MASVRNYKYDNIRFLLIVLVVLCHFLGVVEGERITDLYRVIYTFHMPAFLFLTGIFAKFDGQKFVRNYLIPYVIFQTIYNWFYYAVVGLSDTFEFIYLKPKYVLWYLFVMMVYYLLTPLLMSFHGRSRYAVLLVTVVISVVSGFDAAIDNPALYRVCTFLPFFTAGLYLGHPEAELSLSRMQKRILTALSAGGILAFSIWVCTVNIKKRMLYGKAPYAESGCTPQLRLALILCASLWILFLLLTAPNKKIPVVSGIGGRTFAIFILHGLLVQYLRYINVFRFSEGKNFLIALGLTALTVLILGEKHIYKAFLWIFTLRFLPVGRKPSADSQSGPKQ